MRILPSRAVQVLLVVLLAMGLLAVAVDVRCTLGSADACCSDEAPDTDCQPGPSQVASRFVPATPALQAVVLPAPPAPSPAWVPPVEAPLLGAPFPDWIQAASGLRAPPSVS